MSFPINSNLHAYSTGINSERLVEDLKTLMHFSSADYGQRWWNRISNYKYVIMQTSLLLQLKVGSCGVKGQHKTLKSLGKMQK